jgi:REP element-mobilizing transposase RayT
MLGSDPTSGWSDATTKRIEFPGAWYHIFSRGIAKQEVYLDDNDRHHFLSLIGQVAEDLNVECHGYCLMDNHYHLILHTPDGNLSRAMKRIIGPYTQRLNKRHDRDGPIFNGRFKSEIVEDDTYLLSLSRYVHLDPVAAGLVDAPGKYKWSSYNFYINRAKGPQWIKSEPILRAIGGQRPRQRYRNFVEGKSQPEVTWPPPQPAPSQKKHTQSIKRLSLTLDKGLRLAAAALGISQRELKQSGEIHRPAVLLVLTSLGNTPLSEVAEKFGYANANSLSAALGRWNRNMETNPNLKEAVQKLRTDLSNGVGS